MLRPDTERLWNFLKGQKALRGFVLAGGTALSMYLHHRLSEDLDFMFIGNKLPLERINALRKSCALSGLDFVASDSLNDIREWEDCGLNLSDYQQNFVVGGTVKLTFWAPDQEVLLLMDSASEDLVRVASLEEIFRTKCLVCADRSKLRDWFDLFIMLKEGPFGPMNIHEAFERSGVISKFDIARGRLTHGSPGLNDEGFESLLADAPTQQEMQAYFRSAFNEIEVEIARKSFEEQAELMASLAAQQQTDN